MSDQLQRCNELIVVIDLSQNLFTIQAPRSSGCFPS